MKRSLIPALLGVMLLSGTAQAATSIYPVDTARFLGGSRFDFKVEFDGVVDEKDAKVLINGKDAATIGLLEKDGKTLPMPRRIEGFVTHLADHDWVISVPAAQWTVSALRQVAARAYGLKESDLKARPFNQFRNYVLSQKTAMQLYGAYAAKGMDGLTAEVAQVVRA